MPNYLPSNTDSSAATGNPASEVCKRTPQSLGDLRIFWGQEVYRLEYLVHLLDTGRIKEEYRPKSA